MENKKIKLDIACGNNKREGFIGMDITDKDTQADIVHNVLKTPWPLEEGSVEEVWCSHFIEHIPHGDGYNDPFFDFFNELWRVMAPGATATFLFPYYTSSRAHQDPSHNRFILESTFLYLSEAWRKMNGLQHYPIKTDFYVVKIDHGISEEYHGKSNDAVNYAAMHNWNVVHDLMVTIKKPLADGTKPGKHPMHPSE
jgi:hypothetical protein